VAPTDHAATADLVAELGRRTDVCWVRSGDRTQLVWHAWVDDALAVVSGGGEQPFPEVPEGGRVEVVMRSKDSGGAVLTWSGRVDVVHPDDDAWDSTVRALLARRQNLPDPSEAPRSWAHRSVVRRLVPDREEA
jgi:hypothetical protein